MHVQARQTLTNNCSACCTASGSRRGEYIPGKGEGGHYNISVAALTVHLHVQSPSVPVDIIIFFLPYFIGIL